jgi:hypothetical protein
MDDFSDDGFDDLNDTVLQELENNAIQFTQAQQLGQTQAPLAPPPPPPPQARPPPPGLRPARPPSSAYDFSGFEADDLDDTIVIDELAKEPAAVAPPAVDGPLPPQQPRVVPAVGQPRPTWQQQAGTSNYNTSAGLTSQHLPSRPVAQALPSQRHPGWPAAPQSRHVPPQSQFNRRPPPPAPQIGRTIPPHHAQQSQAARAAPGGAGNQTEIVAALQAQLATLQSELTSAKGEAAIVRSKYEKFQTSHEAEVARLKRLNAEQLAKQERAVEAALAAEKNATTELHFARQDLKEELGRAKVVKRKDDLTSTPKKKNKTWAVADGFDEIEILPSPGKGQGKRRGDAGPVAVPLAERTPTKGKRKRPAVDSPVMALEVHSEDALMADAPEAKGKPQDTDRISGKARHRADDLPFDFLKLVLDHSPGHGQPLTFDLFSRYAFPSDPGQSLAAIMLDKLPDLGKSLDGSPDDPLRLLVDFSELLLVLWTQCNEEKYYTPIYDIVSLLSYTLQLNTVAVVPHLISNLLPLIQTTCLLITIPRTESARGDLSTHPNRSLRQMALEINVTQLLSLLYLAALGCMGPSPSGDTADQTDADNTPLRFQTQFWRHVQLEFLLMLFDKNHPEEDFLGVLSLLCTSVLPASIGPIYNASLSLLPPDFDRPNDQTPEFVARSLIDRVSHQLSEPPAWAPRRSVKECRVRLAVLRTLLAFATSPFGALQLAASASLIPRLVLVLCWAIDNLYDMDVPQSMLKWKPIHGEKDQLDGGRSMTERGDDSVPQDGDPEATQDMPDADVPQPHGPGDVDQGEQASAVDADTLASQTRSTDKTLLLNQIIAQITALLHFLITDPRTSNVANMPAKLAASHGGSHRYLITLARLAFAEQDLVLEAGISARTVDLAHDLLELAVTPDEGEGVGEVFGL